MAANSAAGDFDMPAWLKWAYEWSKGIGLISVIVGLAASAFVGYERGYLVGFFVAGLFVYLFVINVGLRRGSASFDSAVDALTLGVADPKVDPSVIVKGLRKWRQTVAYSVIGLTTLTVVSFGFVIGPAAQDLFTRDIPKTKAVTFEDFRYYRQGDHIRFAEEAPFLEAVVSSLSAEGHSEGVSYRIAIGTTMPFSHPTKKFMCKLHIDGGLHDATGFAFRRSPERGRALYEAIPATYPNKNSVYFAIPPSEKGDKLLVIALLTSTDPSAFPEDLKASSKLAIED